MARNCRVVFPSQEVEQAGSDLGRRNGKAGLFASDGAPSPRLGLLEKRRDRGRRRTCSIRGNSMPMEVPRPKPAA